MNNVLIVISGPAGAGKGTIVNRALELASERGSSLCLSISMTSRPMSALDAEGVTYFFVAADRFKQAIEAGELLEYNCYNGNYYGTPKRNVISHLNNGDDVILEIDVNGGRQIKENYPDVIRVFIMPPSMEELERRIRDRKRDSEEDIIKRLARAEKEIEISAEYDYVIVNDEVDRATNELLDIIESVKSQRA